MTPLPILSLLLLQGPLDGLPKDTVPPVSLRGGTSFVVAPDQPGMPRVRIQLPPGSTRGTRGDVFNGSHGAIVSVIVEGVGQAVRSKYHGLAALASRKFDPKQVILARPWIGVKQFHRIGNSRRMSLRILMFSETLSYSMLASWEDTDPTAYREALRMANFVIRSLKRVP